MRVALDWSFSSAAHVAISMELTATYVPYWRDCLQFYEYFHGDNGAGLGASHQTGWAGFIARAMHVFASDTTEQWREGSNEVLGAPGS